MWQVGAVCYHSKIAALQAAASAQTGAIVAQGGGSYVVGVEAVAENGIQYGLTPIGGGSPLVVQSIQDPVPCNLLMSADVLPIAWAIAAGWIGIALVRALWSARVTDDS